MGWQVVGHGHLPLGHGQLPFGQVVKMLNVKSFMNTAIVTLMYSSYCGPTELPACRP